MKGDALEWIINFEPHFQNGADLKLLRSGEGGIVVGVNAEQGQVYLDRNGTSESNFHSKFLGRYSARLPASDRNPSGRDPQLNTGGASTTSRRQTASVSLSRCFHVRSILGSMQLQQFASNAIPARKKHPLGPDDQRGCTDDRLWRHCRETIGLQRLKHRPCR